MDLHIMTLPHGPLVPVGIKISSFIFRNIVYTKFGNRQIDKLMNKQAV